MYILNSTSTNELTSRLLNLASLICWCLFICIFVLFFYVFNHPRNYLKNHTQVLIYLFLIFSLMQYYLPNIKYDGYDSITFCRVFHIPHSSQIMSNFIFSFPIHYVHRFAYLLKFCFITYQLKTLFF